MEPRYQSTEKFCRLQAQRHSLDLETEVLKNKSKAQARSLNIFDGRRSLCAPVPLQTWPTLRTMQTR